MWEGKVTGFVHRTTPALPYRFRFRYRYRMRELAYHSPLSTSCCASISGK